MTTNTAVKFSKADWANVTNPDSAYAKVNAINAAGVSGLTATASNATSG